MAGAGEVGRSVGRRLRRALGRNDPATRAADGAASTAEAGRGRHSRPGDPGAAGTSGQGRCGGNRSPKPSKADRKRQEKEAKEAKAREAKAAAEAAKAAQAKAAQEKAAQGKSAQAMAAVAAAPAAAAKAAGAKPAAAKPKAAGKGLGAGAWVAIAAVVLALGVGAFFMMSGGGASDDVAGPADDSATGTVGAAEMEDAPQPLPPELSVESLPPPAPAPTGDDPAATLPQLYRIVTRPVGATIMVDGKAVEGVVTPAEIELPHDAKHLLQLELRGTSRFAGRSSPTA